MGDAQPLPKCLYTSIWEEPSPSDNSLFFQWTDNGYPFLIEKTDNERPFHEKRIIILRIGDNPFDWSTIVDPDKFLFL